MRAAILTRTPGAAADLARELPGDDPAWEAPTDLPALCRRVSECGFDVVVAEHALPQISAWDALGALARAHEPPPVVVLGTTSSEELAVEAMRRGAADFVSRQRLDRLRPALARVLAADGRRRGPVGTAEFRSAPAMLWCLDGEGRIEDASDLLLERTGWSRPELAGHPADAIAARAEPVAGGSEWRGELLARDGRRIAVRVRSRGAVWAALDLPGAAEDGILCEADLRELERDNLRAALLACGGRVYGPGGAAARLGLAPTTLASRLRVMGLGRDGARE